MDQNEKIILPLFLLIISITGKAQQLNPVHISYSAKKLAAKTYEVHLTLTIDDGWHTYSQFTPEGGPAPTEIKFNKNPLVILNGNVKEVGKLHQYHEKAFDVDVNEYSEKADFVQQVTLKASVKTNISGHIVYQVCTDEKCLPPKSVAFSVSIKD